MILAFSRGGIYIVFVFLMLFVALVIIIHHYIVSYFERRQINKKRKVKFKQDGKRIKGYWVSKDGERYDDDLKLEDK